MNIANMVAEALDEDLGPGCLTTEACVPPEHFGVAEVRAKQDLVVCGNVLAPEIFRQVSARYGGQVSYLPRLEDGEHATCGDIVAVVEGPLRNLIIGERLALNCMMKLSGIATNVHAWVSAAGASTLRIVDTRKTTPLLREFEKYAVRCGGGANHRMGLYDGVMIKDNHITAVGSIEQAVQVVRASVHHLVKIEVEVSDETQLVAAIDAGADVVLLDNMSDSELERCVGIARSRKPEVLLEASGNMNPTRIASIKDIGLDFVSAGGLIHQATWVDLSMKIVRRSS